MATLLAAASSVAFWYELRLLRAEMRSWIETLRASNPHLTIPPIASKPAGG